MTSSNRSAFFVLNRTLFLTVLGACCIPSAWAEPATSTFNISATVLRACAVASLSNLVRVSYSVPRGGPPLGLLSFTVTCSVGTPYSVKVSTGLDNAVESLNFRMTRSLLTIKDDSKIAQQLKSTVREGNRDKDVVGTGYLADETVQSYAVYVDIPFRAHSEQLGADHSNTVTLTLIY